MEKPEMPGMNPFGAMTDTLDLVKKMWGGMGVPGMTAPTLSVDEINKQITDLKAVESWLSLNMNMLRGTIQALEVQSGTIAALQSISAAMGVPGASPANDAAPPFESPFVAPAAQPVPQGSQQEPEHEPQQDSRQPAKSPYVFPHWSAPATSAAATSATEESKPAAMPDFSGAPVNPAAWWNILQEQFQQAVSQAVAGQSAVGEVAAAMTKAAAPAKAPKASKTTKTPKTQKAAAKPAPRKRKPS